MTSELRTPSPRLVGKRQPKGRFYLAELVQECRRRGLKTSVVWVNIHLIKARSAKEAYAKAVKNGKAHNLRYRAGEKGLPARWIFRGLRQLIPIYEKLADGSEIMFESHERITPAGVRKMIRSPNRLLAFREERRS